MTCIGKDPRCPCQDGDACHYKDCGGTKAWPVPKAEPVAELQQVGPVEDMMLRRAALRSAKIVFAGRFVTKQAEPLTMIEQVDAAMVATKHIYPRITRSQCELIIRAAATTLRKSYD